jgi:hypothetical protein
MLAELLHLTRNLEEQGIPLALVHKDFGKPGLSGNTTLKVVLGHDGKITRLARLTPEEQPGLWTLKHGKKNFFPAVRLPASPLDLSIDDERWSLLEKEPSIETTVRARSPCAQFDPRFDAYDEHGKIKHLVVDLGNQGADNVAAMVVSRITQP